MKEYYKLIYLVLSFSFIFLLNVLMIVKIKENNKVIDENPLRQFVKGNNNDIGCLSVFIDEFKDASYSFDGGVTWQKSNYGAIYKNGEYDILVKNSNEEILLSKKLNVKSIVEDAPVIKVDFDKKIKSFNSEDLLDGIDILYNNQETSNELEIDVLNHDKESVLVSYYVEDNNKKCALLRKIYISEDSHDDSEWLWPTDKPYSISSRYGWRWGRKHNGVDIAGQKRGSYAYAARDGEIVDITSNSSSGYYVIIKHDNGYYTRYAHMQNTDGNDKLGRKSSATKYIKVGQRVKAHDIIGEIGSSGDSTGVHLHFEIWNGKPWQAQSFDPLTFYK